MDAEVRSAARRWREEIKHGDGSTDAPSAHSAVVSGPESRVDDGQDRSLLGLLLIALYLVVVLRTAWLGDDVYITLRTVENFIHGHGLTWNTDERVQAYTHPLWLFVLTAGRLLTGEVYFSTIALSIAISTAAVALVTFRLARSREQAIFAVLSLVASRAFVDFSTSGLETPLSYLLLCLYLAAGRADPHLRSPRAFWLTLLAGLAALNRLDTALLFGPSLLVEWIAEARRRGIGRLARWVLAASLPLIGWELFSLVYYGFPLPNTFYAKLDTGVPTGDLIGQGALYLLDSLANDPLTLLIIAVALGVGFGSPRSGPKLLAAGIVLYFGYVVRIGGDFMSGRFLALPLLAAVCLLARHPLHPSRLAWPIAVAPLVLGILAVPNLPLKTGPDYGYPVPSSAQAIEAVQVRNGIVDERRVYYPYTGLLTYERDQEMPHGWWADEIRRRTTDPSRPLIAGAVGLLGYLAGPSVHVIDENALGDPLLARLPVRAPWRIGHFGRPIPAGYLATVRDGVNQIRDPALHRYEDKLLLVTRGDLFDPARLRAIVGMNLGWYDHWLPVNQPPALVQSLEAVGSIEPLDIVCPCGIELLGYRLVEPPRRPGDELAVEVYWRLTDRGGRMPRRNWAFHFGLLDPDGTERARLETWPGGGSLRTSVMPAGAIYRDRVEFELPPSHAAPGVGRISVRLYTGDGSRAEDRAPLQTKDGVALGDTVDLLRFRWPGPTVEQTPARALDVWFRGGLHLGGGDVPATVRYATPLQVRLYWEAEAPIADDYTVSIQVYDLSGSKVGQVDSQPRGNRYPMTFWPSHEVVADEYWVPLSAPVGARTRVMAVVYRHDTGERLPVVAAPGLIVENQMVEIARVEVRP